MSYHKIHFVLAYKQMIQIETYTQVIIDVQVMEPCDVAVVLHEEQAIEEVLETHVEAEVVPP